MLLGYSFSASPLAIKIRHFLKRLPLLAIMPEDDQRDLLASGRVDHPVEIVDRDLEHSRLLADLRVARSAQNLRLTRRAQERLDDRMLARA